MLRSIIYGSAASTTIAGILHLVLVPMVINFNINSAIFFIISGILQIFWAVPMIKQYGRVWYIIGIIGTAILIILWVITRIEANPITGRAGPINAMGIAIQIFQIAYIILTSIILTKKITKTPKDKDKIQSQ